MRVNIGRTIRQTCVESVGWILNFMMGSGGGQLWTCFYHKMKTMSWVWRSWDRASLMYSFSVGDWASHLHETTGIIVPLLACCSLLNITNKMRCYTIFFITVNALHVSGGFSAHHQELKNCSGSSKQARHIPDAVCTVFELLMMGGETVWNM